MKKNPIIFALFLFSCVVSAPAWATVRVVTSVPSLAALATEIGGDLVTVKSLAAPSQDPHFVDGRPSFIVDLNRADMVVYVGADLEAGWLPSLIINSRNAKIQKGQAGNVDASTQCGPLTDVGKTDRSMGDVHPMGNPHYLYDPRYGVRVAQTIAARLAQIDPDHQPQYVANEKAFVAKMNQKIAAWDALMAPKKGQPLVAYHNTLVYLTNWLGVSAVGFVEPLPGVSPSPRQLADLIVMMRSKKVKAVVAEPWYSGETARIVAQKSNATFVPLPGDVGVKGIDTYDQLIDAIVQSFAKAL